MASFVSYSCSGFSICIAVTFCSRSKSTFFFFSQRRCFIRETAPASKILWFACRPRDCWRMLLTGEDAQSCSNMAVGSGGHSSLEHLYLQRETTMENTKLLGDIPIHDPRLAVSCGTLCLSPLILFWQTVLPKYLVHLRSQGALALEQMFCFSSWCHSAKVLQKNGRGGF